MPAFNANSFTDRMDAGAKARAAQLERARATAEALKSTAAERMAERMKIAADREARRAAKEAARKAEAERIEAEFAKVVG
jgi:hypothetical protein